ncbi:phage baseplate protein [Sphingomonas deserti]|uniref:Phage baseplate protein n=2 Tax=Allosphingosinicella deserti TaxID=2116704 RepID=A0A2P7QZG9_9SPHN|nr:phage baseplate protein [Sphingomonas deserti]
MAAPDPSAILDVWERGLGQPLQRQVVALLAAVRPGTSQSDIAALPLGARDAMLLDLREELFGPALATIATCPQCSEQLEANFALEDVRVSPTAAAEVDLVTVIAGREIRLRPPATADLLAIPSGADAEAVRTILLERCVTGRDVEGKPVAAAALPAAAITPIIQSMARADPQAVVELNLACAACGHHFVAIFDIAAFLMREIHGWARQILRDIDSLARAYGWREADILALSPARRQIYVEMAAS